MMKPDYFERLRLAAATGSQFAGSPSHGSEASASSFSLRLGRSRSNRPGGDLSAKASHSARILPVVWLSSLQKTATRLKRTCAESAGLSRSAVSRAR